MKYKYRLKVPRFVHKAWARAWGYFWLPCPLCRRMFGGHEHGIECLWHTKSTGTLVCRDCAPMAEYLNSQMEYAEFR